MSEALTYPPAAAPAASSLVTRVTRWFLLSGMSFVLNFGLTVVLVELAGWREPVAYATAIGVVTATNFLMCRYFVFSAAGGPIRRQVIGFLTTTLIFRSLEYVAFLGLHGQLGVDYRVAVIVVSCVALVGKFFVYGRLFNGRRAAVPSAG